MFHLLLHLSIINVSLFINLNETICKEIFHISKSNYSGLDINAYQIFRIK